MSVLPVRVYGVGLEPNHLFADPVAQFPTSVLQRLQLVLDEHFSCRLDRAARMSSRVASLIPRNSSFATTSLIGITCTPSFFPLGLYRNRLRKLPRPFESRTTFRMASMPSSLRDVQTQPPAADAVGALEAAVSGMK
ncbi:hypothetical protein FKV24_012705 [Lysobacter maris]|uniref:Uncharacterized protein n=1 Tax=Marilutibacter maris TaxID=1605891 RepID=A0A508AGC3_9GAMM|nr:hypothetical protein FKV24_012705 [Lysobacter maris]